MNQLTSPDRRRRTGSILIVTMFVAFTLAALVLVLCGSMRVEATAAANMTASLQASSVERGAEQYVMAILTEQKDSLSDLTEDYFAAVQVGDGYFWIVRPDYGDDNLPVFGLTDENAKLNLNTATYDMLMRLPNMTDDVASAIVEWRGGSADASSGSGSGSGSGSSAGQSAYYSGLPDPYQSKHAPFETVEEMLLVQGASRELLYGTIDAEPLGVQGNAQVSSGNGATDFQTAQGIYDLLTVYSSEKGSGQQVNINDRNEKDKLRQLLQKQLNDNGRVEAIVGGVGTTQYVDAFDFAIKNKLKSDELTQIYDSLTTKSAATPSGGGNGGSATGGTGAGAGGGGGGASSTVKGRINVNTAPRDVLLCLPNLDSSDVDKLISARQGSAAGDTSVGWVMDALQNKAVGLGNLITGKTVQYSADIVAVSGNGRAYKHCRIVVDTSGSTPLIKYRRDLTDRGWPMDPQILTSLRSGQGLGAWAGAGNTMPGGSFR